jgi:hypothetical protein
MQFFDTITLGQAVEVTGMRETRNGSLVVNARAARGGNVQDYLGTEVGKPEMPIVRVYRDANEIFHKESLKTFGHKPVTLNHPRGPVTSRTWKDVARGHTGEEVLRDGEFVRIPMMVSDQAAIDAVKGGHRELSVGYQCDLDFTPGVTADGKSYDAQQIKIIVDHVAIVDRGRAGPDCRIGDESPFDDGKSMRALLDTADERVSGGDTQRNQPTHKEMVSMKTLTIDGHSVALDDAAFIAVSTLQKQLGTAVSDALAKDAALNTLTADHKKALETKDGEIAVVKTAVETKDGEIAVLKAALKDAELTPAKLDAAVAARAVVANAAKRIVGDKLVVDGKTDAEIRREAVVTKIGDSAKAMSDDAINGAFAALSAQAGHTTDDIAASVRDAANPNNPTIVTDAASAYRAMKDYDSNAWQKAN